MTRRLKKAENTLLGLVIIIALIGWIISKTLDATGIVAPVVIFGALIVGIVWYKHSQRQKRIAYLRGKYGDERVVEMILQRRFWQGQTSEQLMDSLGSPVGLIGSRWPRGSVKYGSTILVE